MLASHMQSFSRGRFSVEGSHMNIHNHDNMAVAMMESEYRGFGRADHSFFLNIRNCALGNANHVEAEEKAVSDENSYVLGYN